MVAERVGPAMTPSGESICTENAYVVEGARPSTEIAPRPSGRSDM
jgi:hypothetical protein